MGGGHSQVSEKVLLVVLDFFVGSAKGGLVNDGCRAEYFQDTITASCHQLSSTMQRSMAG
jgi:hypothetical protein